MKLKVYGDDKIGFKGAGESDDEHLEPCPFCSSRSIVIHNTHTPSYWAECNDCGAEGPRTTYPRREARSRAGVRKQHEAVFTEAVILWNTRRYSDR